MIPLTHLGILILDDRAGAMDDVTSMCPGASCENLIEASVLAGDV